MVDSRTAFLTGTCGACSPSPVPGASFPGPVGIAGTSDGGETWQRFPVPGLPSSAQTEVSFATAQDGWLIATWTVAPGVHTSGVFMTMDGSRTWVTETPALS